MIVNIPLQIDEAKMEEVLAKDYEGRVLKEITSYIKTTLASHAEKYYGDREKDGMRVLIEGRIDVFIKQHKDEIIDKAAVYLAKKLAASKRGKELLGEVARNG